MPLPLEKGGAWHVHTGNQFYTRSDQIAAGGGGY